MPPGLIRRNGRYYLRRVIPLDLQAHFGRREITKALVTSVPAEVPADRPATETPLASVVDRWAASERPGDRNVRRTRKIVQRFETVNGKIAVEAVTKQHAVAFREVLQAEGQTPANINVMIPMLGVVFNYAIKRLHLISVNPAAGLRVRLARGSAISALPV